MAKKILLALWCIVSIGWMAAMAWQLRLGDAVDTYGSYYQKINDINNGTATSYDKKAYMESGPELERAGKRFGIFILIGLGLPFAALLTGRSLMNPRDKTAQKKR